VQFDPPDDPEDYIHRVGRTARGADGKGKALLFLLEHELGFLRYLRVAKIKPNEYEFPENKLAAIQDQFMKLIERNYYLNCSARDAYKSFMQSYASHKLRDIFDVNKVDLLKVAHAFGLANPPRVNLNVKTVGRSARNHKMKE
jgi:ATP-dependent RNA helicase DDX18/HAS1